MNSFINQLKKRIAFIKWEVILDQNSSNSYTNQTNMLNEETGPKGEQ